MIVNDGGSGSFVETSPGMLSVWDTLLTVRALAQIAQSWVHFQMSNTLCQQWTALSAGSQHARCAKAESSIFCWKQSMSL